MPFQNQETLHDIKNPKLTDDHFIKEIKKYILTHLSDSEIVVLDLCSHMGMSNSSFYRRVKHLTKLSPVELIKRIRLNEAASILKKGNVNISDTAYSTGFSEQSYFTACFKKQFGVTPSKYMKMKSTKASNKLYN